MDKIDYQIFTILRENSRTPITKLSAMVNLSRPSVQERLNKLTNNKTIESFTITSHPKNLGYNITFYIMISDAKVPTSQLLDIIKEDSKIIEASSVTGKVAFITKGATTDIDSLNTTMSKIREHANCEALIVLNEEHQHSVLDPIYND